MLRGMLVFSSSKASSTVYLRNSNAENKLTLYRLGTSLQGVRAHVKHDFVLEVPVELAAA